MVLAKKLILIIGTICCLFAIMAQFLVVLIANNDSVGVIILRFFSFFTIIGNAMIVIYFLKELRLIKRDKILFKLNLFSPIKVVSLATFVTIGYHVLLQDVWTPEGIQWFANQLLHIVVPVICIIHWLFFVDKKKITWRVIPGVLVIPILYFVYIMILGEFSINYPYPFFDVDELGYSKVFATAVVLLFAYGIITSIFVGISKLTSKRS